MLTNEIAQPNTEDDWHVPDFVWRCIEHVPIAHRRGVWVNVFCALGNEILAYHRVAHPAGTEVLVGCSVDHAILADIHLFRPQIGACIAD